MSPSLRPLLFVAAMLQACAAPPTSATRPARWSDPIPPDPDAAVIVDLRPRNVDVQLLERAPATLAPVPLPMGVEALFPWVDADGRGFVVTRDARFYSIDAYGVPSPIERRVGDVRGAMESPPNALVEVTHNEPTAFVPDGALVVREGNVQRAQLPSLLANARAMVRWGTEALWATTAGLFTTQGPRWLRLDRDGRPVTDVVALAPAPLRGATRDAWVLRASGELLRLRVTPGMGDVAEVVWSDPAPGLAVGNVRAIESYGEHRYMARGSDLLRVHAEGAIERVRIPGMDTGPVAFARGGRWLWIAWGGGATSALGRFDGTRIEVVGRGLFADTLRIAANRATGDVALFVANGRVWRVVTEAAPQVLGFEDGAVVTEARLPFQVFPPTPSAVSSVRFLLDGMMVERVITPPFRWGPGGAELHRSFPALRFGEHTVEAIIAYDNTDELRVRRRFRYLSPLGRVPTYTADIRPLYESACARCHSTNIARDLRGYHRLADMAPLIAAVVLSRRMPADTTLDTPSIQLVTSWVAGGAPE